jgi:hypothetical protein
VLAVGALPNTSPAPRLDGSPVNAKPSFVFAVNAIQPTGGLTVTKAQEVFEKVEAMTASGEKKADAFKQLAEEYGQPVDSIRGSYYSHKRAKDGGTSGGGTRRTRRRETTPEDAVQSAAAALTRSIDNIDLEVEAAKDRADEAKSEYEAMKASAKERKQAIEEKLDLLGSVGS